MRCECASCLAGGAEDSRAAVDRVRSDETSSAAKAGKSFASICLEFFGESAAFALRIAVVAEACSAKRYGLIENVDDLAAERSGFCRSERACSARRVDARAPECFVGVN